MEFCDRCGQPLDPTAPHVSIVRHVEVLDGEAVTVLLAEQLEQMHVECAPLLDTARHAAGQTPARSAAEPGTVSARLHALRRGRSR